MYLYRRRIGSLLFYLNLCKCKFHIRLYFKYEVWIDNFYFYLYGKKLKWNDRIYDIFFII